MVLQALKFAFGCHGDRFTKVKFTAHFTAYPMAETLVEAFQQVNNVNATHLAIMPSKHPLAKKLVAFGHVFRPLHVVYTTY